MEIVAHADLDRGNVVLRHHAAGDLVAEFEACPRGRGLMVTTTSPNWPWPPDCFLWRPRTSVDLRMVSL